MARKKWKPTKEDYVIAENYKRLREDTINRENKDKQYTQRNLAIAFKKDEHYSSRICDIENATVQPSIEDMKLYHNFFKVPYEFLLGETNSKRYENMAIAKELGLSDAVINVLRSWQNEQPKRNLVEVLNYIFEAGYIHDLLEKLRLYLFAEAEQFIIYDDENGKNIDKPLGCPLIKNKEVRAFSENHNSNVRIKLEDVQYIFQQNLYEVLREMREEARKQNLQNSISKFAN